LGADEIISLKNEDTKILSLLKEIYEDTPVDIVLDYIWGHPAELILSALKDIEPYPVRIISIGSMAGLAINLPSGLLRSKQIEILGSGIGSLSREDITNYMTTVLPDMFQLLAGGKLKIEIEVVELKDVENVWENSSDSRKRTVVRI
jgi:NADPH:quinone reductase-like Zn-dependent oxidoreductase